ncbi:major facilitator superfamily domain-containing protein [Aspergillus nidulans var. acristatus]
MPLTRPPWLLRFRSSTVFIISTVWVSSFTGYFLYAMVVPILPTALAERAHVPYQDRGYWVSLLLMSEALTAFLCCPLFGYLVDIAPTRRLPYLLGLIFLGASMGLLAIARTTVMFVIARLLQGGATAMVAVTGLALLTDSVPLDNLGQTIGYQGSAVALGFLLGPLLGGIVYDKAGYDVVFRMAFALVGLDLVMRVAMIEKGVAAKWVITNPSAANSQETILSSRGDSGYQTFAEAQEIETESGESTLTDGQSQDYEQESEYGDAHPPTFVQIAKQPRVVISSFGLLVQGLLFSAFDATIPIFVETTFNWTPLGAGLAFLPSALTALFEPFFGYISDKQGPRLPTFTSFFILPFPLMSLTFVTTNSPAMISLLLTLLTLIGLLINFATPALFVETQDVLVRLQQSVPSPLPSAQDRTQTQMKRDERQSRKQSQVKGIAQAFGIQTMAQFLGMLLGSLWGGFVEWRFGWKTMVYSLGVLCFVTSWTMLGLGEDAGGYRTKNGAVDADAATDTDGPDRVSWFRRMNLRTRTMWRNMRRGWNGIPVVGRQVNSGAQTVDGDAESEGLLAGRGRE